MIRRKTGWGIFVLALLAAGSFWANRGQKEPGPPPIAGLDTRLDYALQAFELRMFDRDGAPSVRLLAPAMSSDAVTGISTVESPSIEVAHPNGDWRIVAEAATVAADREVIRMRGNVNLHRDATPAAPVLDIRTSELSLAVTPQTAHSDQAVRMVEGPHRMDAVGFRVNIRDNTFQLLNQVKVTYAIN